MKVSPLIVVMFALLTVSAALGAPEKTLPDGRHQIALSVPDMECSMCVHAVQAELRRLSGVVDMKLDDINRVVVVKFDPTVLDVKRIQAAIRKAGFVSQPVEQPPH